MIITTTTKYSQHITKQPHLYAETFVSFAVYPRTVMIIGQADCYIPVAIKPNSLATVNVVIYQHLAIGTGFDPRPLHVCLWLTKWFWDIFCSENFDLSVRTISKIFLTHS